MTDPSDCERAKAGAFDAMSELNCSARKPALAAEAIACSPRARPTRWPRASATDKDVEIGGAGLAGAAIELGLVDELRLFRYPVIVGGGTPLLPPVTQNVPLDLVETRTFDSRVIYERYRR